jgi:formamidopyrimidine-DNA glycosylase
LPELPEVETIRRGLIPRLVGCTIKRVVLSNRRLRLPVPRAKLKGWVEGGQVKSVDRRAKYLLIRMNSGAVLVLHLGMTGRLAFFTNGAPRNPHDHIRFFLDNSLELRFNDVRRFGSIQVLAPENGKLPQIFADLGAEPLGPDFSAPYLMRMARKRTRPIKNFLMDAKVVVGIGNIYANEILFVAGIKPTRGVGTLTRATWERVVKGSREILEQAIACGGTTISDYVNSSGEVGYFQCELKVYGRAGEACKSCGSEISRVVLSGRASFYCSKCQR